MTTHNEVIQRKIDMFTRIFWRMEKHKERNHILEIMGNIARKIKKLKENSIKGAEKLHLK